MGPIDTKVLNGVTRFIDLGANNDLNSIFYWQGYYHASDRYIQMELLRIIASGRLCEYLDDSVESLAIDQFMREMGFEHYAQMEIETFDEETLASLNSYCSGVNEYSSKKRSFFFKMLGVKYRPWSVKDCILTLKIMSYIGLAQGQQDLEKFIIESLKNGVNPKKIESLISNQEKITTDILCILEKVKLHNTIIPQAMAKLNKLPKIHASNNWVVSLGSSTIHACDPHLECNRLPSIWYEMQIKANELDLFGISMPGVPGIVMGNKNNLTYSFTYGFMDMTDYFTEEIKAGKYRDEENFINLKLRKEIIKRKKNNDIELKIYESENGVIEYDSKLQNIEDGHYLSLAWSCQKTGAAQTFKAICNILKAQTIDELSSHLKNICISCNWLISDNLGNIAYQQSGIAPLRIASGLIPKIGHIKANKWRGLVDSDSLYKVKNPTSGFLATANNQIPHDHSPKLINSPMGSYRVDYITQLLKDQTHSCDLFKNMQNSSYSLASKLFDMKYKKFFDDSKLRNFDFCYETNSIQANQFEYFYQALITDFLSDHFYTQEASNYLLNETCIIADFYSLFDRLFLEDLNDDEIAIWFSKKSQADYIKEALSKIPDTLESWGQRNIIDFNFILTDGKLPAFITKDRRNVSIKGNRSTISQGSVYKSKGRKTSFLPSWRMIHDSRTNIFFSCLPGGLNDAIFSKYYQSDLDNWIEGAYRQTKK